MRLRTKIQLSFSVTVLILIMTVGFVSLLESNSASMEMVNNSINSSTTLAASQISDKFDNCLKIVSFVGKNIGETFNGSIDAKNVSPITAILDEYVATYGFTSANILSTDGVSLIDGTDFSDRQYVITALEGTPNVSDITLSKYTNTYGVSVAGPICDAAGRIYGVVYFRLDTDFIQNILDSIQISENNYAYLIDKTGNVVAHPNEEMILNFNLNEQSPEMQKIANDAASGIQGTSSYNFNNQEIVCGYAPISFTNDLSLVLAAPEDDFTFAFKRVAPYLIILDVIALVVALLLSSLISSQISKPIVRVKDVLLQVAQGDFSSEIEHSKGRDEVAVLQNTTSDLVNTLSDIIGRSNTLLGNISSYDLTSESMPVYPGEFNNLSASINSIQETLRNLISQVQESIYSVEVSSHELADAANALSEGTLVQANSIQTLVTDLDDVVERINRSSENEHVVNGQLVSLDKQIQTGGQQMKELLNVVDNIETMSSDIAKIVGTIDSIAFQTNILSLNASVEAAHAGDMGKGFAVVAEEVRGLAAKCGDASKKTAELITECISSITNAKVCADGTFSSLTEIVSGSAEISNAFVQIAEDTSEQAMKSNRIQEEIKNISDVVQTNTATAEQTAASTQLLSQQADELKQMIARFRV